MANHVRVKDGTVKCDHCTQEMPVSSGTARWCADVLYAFSNAHNDCDKRDRWDAPLCDNGNVPLDREKASVGK